MNPRIEVVGEGSSSLPKRMRKFFAELFEDRYVERLERELLQVRLDKDRQIAELKQERDTLLNAVLATKGIPIRQPSIPPTSTGIPRQIGPTRWEQLQAEAVRDNARAEAAEKQAVKEN